MMHKKNCNHKWKYLGFYNGGYYNQKLCIHCNKIELEKSTNYDTRKNKNRSNV